jgi:hypothetical protein
MIAWVTMTHCVECLGWFAIVGNFFTLQQTGPGIGGCGTILLGLAYAGAFNWVSQ